MIPINKITIIIITIIVTIIVIIQDSEYSN